LNTLEMLGVALSLAGVGLTMRRHPACWPVGLLSVMVYAVVFVQARLYSDALLQGVFAALLVYGAFKWRKLRGGRPEKTAVQLPTRAAVFWPLLAGVAGALALGLLTATYTDAALPWLDAALTAASLVAQYWMGRCFRIHWLGWIAVDVIYVGVYLNRDLPLTAGLYALFIAMAVQGWRDWSRS
jgi:nicotinamide mononucleotide transporter